VLSHTSRSAGGTGAVGFRIGMPRRPMSPLKHSVRSRSGPVTEISSIADPRMWPASTNLNCTVRVTSTTRP
jgi:hypothetical protein